MTRGEYDDLKRRVEIGGRKIQERGGFFEAPKLWVDKYNEFSYQMLMYEIENDLLPLWLYKINTRM